MPWDVAVAVWPAPGCLGNFGWNFTDEARRSARNSRASFTVAKVETELGVPRTQAELVTHAMVDAGFAGPRAEKDRSTSKSDYSVTKLGSRLCVARFVKRITRTKADASPGALYCQYQMSISPDTVSGILVSLQIVFAVIVGGLFGPTVGAVITIMLAEGLRIGFGTKAVGWDNLVYGVLLVVFIIILPRGILGSLLKGLKTQRKP
jgi:hypothetical protein